jgi:hypothetical protein
MTRSRLFAVYKMKSQWAKGLAYEFFYVIRPRVV